LGDRAQGRVLIDPEDRLRIPLIGFVVAALLTLAFVVGAFDALITNHFSSWHRLTLRPSDQLARSIENTMPVARVTTMIGAAGFGYTTVRRSNAEGLRIGLLRLGAVAFLPIVVELADVGTQDGSVPDLDLLPIHSLALLGLISVAPAALAASDWRQIRSVPNAG
jgi:hypothetical protein